MPISAIKLAEEHGAKLHRNALLNPNPWIVLDQRDNSLWTRSFKTKRAAALAFIHEKRLSQFLYR